VTMSVRQRRAELVGRDLDLAKLGIHHQPGVKVEVRRSEDQMIS